MNSLLTDCLGICDIGQNIKKTGYVLLRYVSNVMIEPFISISNEEMQANGISIVLDNLRKTPVPNSYKKVSMFDAGTKKLMYKLKKSHLLVSLSLLKKLNPESQNIHEELKMTPLHAKHGWQFGTRKEEIHRLPLPILNHLFMRHLAEAFEIAS